MSQFNPGVCRRPRLRAVLRPVRTRCPRSRVSYGRGVRRGVPVRAGGAVPAPAEAVDDVSPSPQTLSSLLSCLSRSTASWRKGSRRTPRRHFRKACTPLAPKVRVHGFPVLTQAASGTLRQVDITAQDIPACGTDRPLPVRELALLLHGVTKSDDGSEVRARSAQATAYLSYRGSRRGWRGPRSTAPGRRGAGCAASTRWSGA